MQNQPLSVFSAAYWRAARAEFRNVRVLAFSGLVCAMAMVLETMPIYLLGPTLKIYFSFLAVSLGCMCYGPLVGIMAGAVIDSVGFLISSYGEPYFPGLMISAMLSGLIYGVMLYRRKPTVWRIILTRLIINYGINVLLGSVWKAMLYGKGYLYYATSGLVKNTIMLPIEVFLMWVVLNAAVRYGLDRKYIHGTIAR
ncbi:folate family ECF transporter S component [Subdoligranulum variabile]|uniref:folate family ECF transporter S component n=1 Tax=Subdoligranulum variabile TaxID=214851 RepID=UPI002942C29A|nr:folate family ECF transporter S component [Subdoligranulum variabile]